MKWLVATDPYTENSNGIKLMHQFCHKLNSMGEEAYIAFVQPGHEKISIDSDPKFINPNLNTPVLKKELITVKAKDEFIVVYPEVVIGNPLNAKKIVRWLGNRQSNWPSRDRLSIEKDAFVLSHSKIFHDDPDAVIFNPKIDDMFFMENEYIKTIPFKDRTLDLIYHGKGVYYGKCEVFKNTFLLSRFYPQNREQLALIFKQCRFYYTYDSLTNTNGEALAAGAVPIFLRYDPWTEQDIDNIEHGYFPRGKVEKIEDGYIYSSVDYDLFLSQREQFFENCKYLQITHEKRLEEAIKQIIYRFSDE